MLAISMLNLRLHPCRLPGRRKLLGQHPQHGRQALRCLKTGTLAC